MLFRSQFVRVGMNNFLSGSVLQPPEIDLRLSLDGVTWTQPLVFTTADASEAQIPAGKRGDVTLKVALAVAKFVEVKFVSPGTWTFVDEMGFD